MYKLAFLIDQVACKLESLGLIKEAHDLDIIANTLEAAFGASRFVSDDKKIQLEFDDKKNRFEIQFPDLAMILGPNAAIPLSADESEAKKVFEEAKSEARRPGNVMELYNKVLNMSKQKGVQHVR